MGPDGDPQAAHIWEFIAPEQKDMPKSWKGNCIPFAFIMDFVLFLFLSLQICAILIQ